MFTANTVSMKHSTNANSALRVGDQPGHLKGLFSTSITLTHNRMLSRETMNILIMKYK
jgi:hypothetical protein